LLISKQITHEQPKGVSYLLGEKYHQSVIFREGHNLVHGRVARVHIDVARYVEREEERVVIRKGNRVIVEALFEMGELDVTRDQSDQQNEEDKNRYPNEHEDAFILVLFMRRH
jgi:hypothetical protein